MEFILNNFSEILGTSAFIIVVIIGYFREKAAEKKGYEKAIKESAESFVQSLKDDKDTDSFLSGFTESEHREYARDGILPERFRNKI